jgi:predicted cupin superfamily sugar epimerase
MDKNLDQLSAKEVIDRFNLTTLEGEGGFWAPLERTEFGNSILFLTTEVDSSAWHKLNESESWFHFAGAPLTLHTLNKREYSQRTLDRNSTSIHHLVPAGVWMAAESTGRWSLIVCTLAPAFSGMELATREDFKKMCALNPEIEKLDHLLSKGHGIL